MFIIIIVIDRITKFVLQKLGHWSYLDHVQKHVGSFATSHIDMSFTLFQAKHHLLLRSPRKWVKKQ